MPVNTMDGISLLIFLLNINLIVYRINLIYVRLPWITSWLSPKPLLVLLMKSYYIYCYREPWISPYIVDWDRVLSEKFLGVGSIKKPNEVTIIIIENMMKNNICDVLVIISEAMKLPDIYDAIKMHQK